MARNSIRIVSFFLSWTMSPERLPSGISGVYIWLLNHQRQNHQVAATESYFRYSKDVDGVSVDSCSFIDINTALVTVWILGQSVNLIVYQTSGYNHCGAYNIIPTSGGFGERWSSPGPGESTKLTADNSFVLVDILSGQPVSAKIMS